jgi:hypothetical protein
MCVNCMHPGTDLYLCCHVCMVIWIVIGYFAHMFKYLTVDLNPPVETVQENSQPLW